MFESSMEALFKHDFNLAESVIEKLSSSAQVGERDGSCAHITPRLRKWLT